MNIPVPDVPAVLVHRYNVVPTILTLAPPLLPTGLYMGDMAPEVSSTGPGTRGVGVGKGKGMLVRGSDEEGITLLTRRERSTPSSVKQNVADMWVQLLS